MAAVWGTAEAPVIIQRDPAAAADPTAGPAVIDVIDMNNCSYIYFRDIYFRARNSPASNIVNIRNRWGGGWGCNAGSSGSSSSSSSNTLLRNCRAHSAQPYSTATLLLLKRMHDVHDVLFYFLG
jgi:hypothetical protein